MAWELIVAILAIVGIGAGLHKVGETWQAQENAWLRLLFVFAALLCFTLATYGALGIVTDSTSSSNSTTITNTTNTYQNATTNTSFFNATGNFNSSTISQTPILISSTTTSTQTTPAPSSATSLAGIFKTLGYLLLIITLVPLAFTLIKLLEMAVEYFKKQGEEAKRQKFG